MAVNKQTIAMSLQIMQSTFHASQVCIWLRLMAQNISETYGLPSEKGTSTTLYEDDAASTAQLKEEYIKGDKTKHIYQNSFSSMILKKW